MENIEMYLNKNFPHIDIADIGVIIECAKDDVLNFCHINEMPLSLNNTLLQMCIHKCNLMQDIGLTNTGGVANVMLDHNYPNNVITNLKRYRVLE